MCRPRSIRPLLARQASRRLHREAKPADVLKISHQRFEIKGKTHDAPGSDAGLVADIVIATAIAAWRASKAKEDHFTASRALAMNHTRGIINREIQAVPHSSQHNSEMRALCDAWRKEKLQIAQAVKAFLAETHPFCAEVDAGVRKRIKEKSDREVEAWTREMEERYARGRRPKGAPDELGRAASPRSQV